MNSEPELPSLTPDTLARLRAVAEAATKACPHDWETDVSENPLIGTFHMVYYTDDEECVETVADALIEPVAEHIAAFDPPTCLSLLSALDRGAAEREAANKVVADLNAEVAELKAFKFAVEQTPKQWSTAQAPTLEAIAGTARGMMAEQKVKDLTATVARLRAERDDKQAQLSAARLLIPAGTTTFGTPAAYKTSRGRCHHCGYETGTLEDFEAVAGAINEHVKVCQKHPQRAVEAERDWLRAELAGARACLEGIARGPRWATGDTLADYADRAKEAAAAFLARGGDEKC